jgi:hypothetical protein
MLLEEDVERSESAEDVLREVGPVHADDQVVAPALQELLLVLQHLARLGRPLQPRRVNAERVGADPGLPPVVKDGAALIVHLELHQVAAAVQEVAAIRGGVEADDVVGQQPVVDRLAHARRQDPP